MGSSRTAVTATVHALDHAALLELGLGHSAHTIGAKVGITRLYAPQTAQVLVALLLPLGNEVSVGDLLRNAVVVELLGDGLALVVQIVDVARLLMMNLEYGPEHLGLALALVRRHLGILHLHLQLVQCRLIEVTALRWRLSLVS